jgi:hypothetical protein
MIKENVYRYFGRNGILTTKILLDGISHIDFVELRAEKGKILTDGTRLVHSIVVEPHEVSLWQEITDKTK